MENGRLKSLDALRGFDMLLIMGFGWMLYDVCCLWPGGEHFWLARQMEHAAWNGLTLFDTVFPLFLFISGMTFPFSLAKRREKGLGDGSTVRKVLIRALIMVALGMVYNGCCDLDFASMRFYSVLGRIGIAWALAALLYMAMEWKPRAVIAAVILIGYNLLLTIVAPDRPGADPLSMDGNLVGYVDRCLMPGHLYFEGFDPEGLLSTLPAVVTAMLGQFAGEFVRSGRPRKTLSMLGAAAVLLGLGLIWSLWLPVNKSLWTSSFVLVVAAYSLALFALFYYLIDVRGWKKWAFPLEVIGLNSITIYMLQRIVSIQSASRFLFGGLAGLFPAQGSQVILGTGYVLLSWLLLYFLYRKKVFLKI